MQSRNSTGSAPQVMTSLTLIATRSIPRSRNRPVWRCRSAFEPTVSVPAASTGSTNFEAEIRPGEAAERAEHERRAGRVDGGAQAVDDGVGRVERDAGLGVGERRVLAQRTPLTSKRRLSTAAPSGATGYSPVRQARQKPAFGRPIASCRPSRLR